MTRVFWEKKNIVLNGPLDWCLMAPSHHLSQCWLIIRRSCGIHHKEILFEILMISVTDMCENSLLLITFASPPADDLLPGYPRPSQFLSQFHMHHFIMQLADAHHDVCNKTLTVICCLLWPVDNIWNHKCWSTLARVMACYLLCAMPSPAAMPTRCK